MISKLNSYLFIVLFCALISPIVLAQDSVRNGELKFIFFEAKEAVTPRQAFSYYKNLLGTSDDDQFRIEKVKLHKAPNYMKYEYVQFHKGLQVPNTSLKIIAKGTKVVSVMGTVAQELQLNVEPKLTTKQALDIVISTFKEQQKLDKQEEAYIQKTKATLLIYFSEKVNLQSFHVAYKFDFYNKSYFIDVHSGAIL